MLELPIALELPELEVEFWPLWLFEADELMPVFEELFEADEFIPLLDELLFSADWLP